MFSNVFRCSQHALNCSQIFSDVGLVGFVGLRVWGLMSLLGFVGLVGLLCQDGLILGIFLLFNFILKYFQMEI